MEKLENTHKEELENEKRKAAEATESAKKDFKNQLLVLSRFLRAATALRHAGVTNTDESDAFEGALVQIYGGTEEAVFSMLKLINGSEEKLTSATSEPLDVTCKSCFPPNWLYTCVILTVSRSEGQASFFGVHSYPRWSLD